MKTINNQDVINLNNWYHDHEVELIDKVETESDSILGSLAGDIIDASIQIDSYGICSKIPLPLIAIVPVLTGKIRQYNFWKNKLNEQTRID